ncbi:MAG: protoporphyrinogen oxidase [Deltaproteobacteria bacterium]|nr:MAG: protoporphyrinogen oxidase [Deltaproteobacteria bacterium]
MKKVVVIGGGLSGLSAARAVKDAAAERGIGVELTLLEKDDVPGGKIRSLREDGYLCETGPNGFLDNKPSTMALTRRMGIENLLYKSDDNARKRFIFTNGKLEKLPEDPLSFIMSEVLSIRGKLRLAADFFLPQGEPGKDETVAEFVRRRIGEEALDKLIDPMSAGIYAGDPSVMSVIACFPKVKMIEDQFGGLLKGMLAMQKMAKAQGRQGPQSAGPGGTLWSYGEGAGVLPTLLAKELGEGVKTGVEARALERNGSGWLVATEGGEYEADEVVLATPAYAASKLLAPHSEEASRLMSNIPYVKMAVVCLGYDKGSVPHPLDGFGFLIPKKEGRKILGSLWSSSIFPNRAPEGKALFTLMMGGARSPELATLPEEELLAACRDEMAVTLGATKEPEFVKIVRWDKAIPQYLVGHLDRVKVIEREISALGGVTLGGNAYYGIGINDCTMRAELIGQMVAEKLAKTGGA